MKNQYFGDVKDYLTYGLLRTICQASGLRLGIAWMLTPHVANGQGELRAYLRHPENWRDCDAELFDRLCGVPETGRAVALAEQLAILPGAAYFSELLPGDTIGRAAYFQRLYASMQGCEIMFFDPDNGLETANISHGTRRSHRHLYWDELAQAYHQHLHSLLVFQHFPRRPHAAYLSERAEQIARRLGVGQVGWFEASQVAFFWVARPEHAAALAEVPAAVQAQWGQRLRPGSLIAEHAAALRQPGLNLALFAGRLAVCRLEAQAALPAWVSGPLTALTRTPAELSVVCAEACVPAGVRAERGWRALQVAGPLDFALTGILAALAAPLASAGVSIFAISTFDTDYLLVKENSLPLALATLRAAGHHIHELT